MTQTITLQIKQPFANPLKKGYPLLTKDAVDVRQLPARGCIAKAR